MPGAASRAHAADTCRASADLMVWYSMTPDDNTSSLQSRYRCGDWRGIKATHFRLAVRAHKAVLAAMRSLF